MNTERINDAEKQIRELRKNGVTDARLRQAVNNIIDKDADDIELGIALNNVLKEDLDEVTLNGSSSNDHQEIMEFCAKNNPSSYNYNKALEELIELQEVIVKMQTKHPSNPKAPDKKELIKEFGDVIYRCKIMLMDVFPDMTQQDLEKEVNEHISKKLTNLEKYKNKGTYKGGL